jgi:hypothetical protein
MQRSRVRISQQIAQLLNDQLLLPIKGDSTQLLSQKLVCCLPLVDEHKVDVLAAGQLEVNCTVDLVKHVGVVVGPGGERLEVIVGYVLGYCHGLGDKLHLRHE